MCRFGYCVCIIIIIIVSVNASVEVARLTFALRVDRPKRRVHQQLISKKQRSFCVTLPGRCLYTYPQ